MIAVKGVRSRYGMLKHLRCQEDWYPEPTKAELLDKLQKVEQMLARVKDNSRKRGMAGGAARAKKLSPERRAEIARLAAAARWGKKADEADNQP